MQSSFFHSLNENRTKQNTHIYIEKERLWGLQQPNKLSATGVTFSHNLIPALPQMEVVLS